MAGRAHGQYTTTPSGRPFGRRAGRPRRITGHSLVFCSELVRRRRRGYIDRSTRLSAGEVGLNLVGTTHQRPHPHKKRIGPRARRMLFMGRQIAIFPLGIIACVRWVGRDETSATGRAAGRSAGCWASRPAPWRRTNGASPHYLHCAGPPLARLSATARAGIFVGPIAAAATRIDMRNCAAFIHIAPTQDNGHIF